MCHNYSILPLQPESRQRQYANGRAMLLHFRAVFIKTGGRAASARGLSFAKLCP